MRGLLAWKDTAVRPPSPGNWSSRYGWRGEGVTRNFHHGLDIGWAAGRTLVAPEDGEIIHYGRLTGWRLGIVQIIRGVSGYDHWLAHTDHSLRGLGPVKEGQPVSVMGDTDAPGQVHVHWETRLNGERLDPEAWLARPAGGDATPFPESETKDDDMPQIITGDGYHPLLLKGDKYYPLNSGEKLEAALRIATRRVDTKANKRQFQLIRNMYTPGDIDVEVVLSDEQLKAITDAARAGGADAVKGLDFVVTTSVTAT